MCRISKIFKIGRQLFISNKLFYRKVIFYNGLDSWLVKFERTLLHPVVVQIDMKGSLEFPHRSLHQQATPAMIIDPLDHQETF